jgi:predicted porin
VEVQLKTKNLKSTSQKQVGAIKRSGGMLLASAVLAAAPVIAMADSNVQIFGIIDTGILVQSKTVDSTGQNAGSSTSMASNGMRQSILGFKGTEDLGSGLKAFFNLESHFDAGNGANHYGADSVAANTVWRRQSNLGLSGDWGSLTFGRQYGPALLAHLGTEPRIFRENFSNLYAWALQQLPTTHSVAGNNDVGIFFDNSVQYRNTLGPVSFGVLYALGGVAGDTSKNSAWAVGAAYNGPVTVSASYQQVKDAVTSATDIKQYGLGLAVPFADGAVKLNYLEAKNNDGVSGVEYAKYEDWGLGVEYKWSPMNTVTLAYYDNKDKLNTQNETKNWVLSNDYAFSKRTTLYALLANIDAKIQADLHTSIVAQANFVPGAKTTYMNVGLNHTF